MTDGEKFVAAIDLKSAFHDRHEKRAYARAVEIAKQIIDNPSLIENAEAFLDRHVRRDPHQARYYDLWKRALQMPPEAISRALLEDSDKGAELRESAPVFTVLGGEPDIEILVQ